MTKLTCLKCHRYLIRTRGQCDMCHKRSLESVRSGETTWEQLEAAGEALPAKAKFGKAKRC